MSESPYRWARIQHRGRARLLSRLSVAALLAPVVLVHGIGTLGPISALFGAGSLDLAISIYLGAVGLSALLAGLAVLAEWPVHRTGGALSWDADALLLTRPQDTLRVPRAEIEGGLVVITDHGPCAELSLADGRVIRVGLQSRAAARALLDEIGLGAEGRRLVSTQGGPRRQLAVGCLAFPLAFTIWAALVTRFEAVLGDLTPTLLALLVVATTLLARRFARPPEVIVGAEGVVLRAPFAADRFVRFDAIERGHREGRALVMTMAGSEPPLRIACADADLAEALAARINAAGARARGGQRPTPVAEVLDPGERELPAWREALSRLLRAEGRYRSAAVDLEDVADVLEDPAAPPRLRIGAALALRGSDEPRARVRVRLAAEACAEDRVRAALEAAAGEGEIDDEVIKKAMS